MISPFFPWFLAFLLLIACVALLVLLLRYRDRTVRLEAESRSWQERAEDRTQMLRRAEEVLKDSFRRHQRGSPPELGKTVPEPGGNAAAKPAPAGQS